MIIVPDNIIRKLNRIEEIYSDKYWRGGSYLNRESLERYVMFERFKRGLENGTSLLLQCEVGAEQEAIIKLLKKIRKWYDPLWAKDIHVAEADINVESELLDTLKKVSEKKAMREEALSILEVIENAGYSSWGQMDNPYRNKEFKLIQSYADFKKYMRIGRELTEGSEKIRVALLEINWQQMLILKGEKYRYKNFLLKNSKKENFGELWEAFLEWYGVREKAVYYVYIPQNFE